MHIGKVPLYLKARLLYARQKGSLMYNGKAPLFIPYKVPLCIMAQLLYARQQGSFLHSDKSPICTEAVSYMHRGKAPLCQTRRLLYA